jgi:hypothetical protein
MAKHSLAKFHGQPPEFPNQCEGAITGGARRCRRKAIAGSNVCIRHGGAAPQVKASARERLALMVSPALNKLHTIITAKKNDPHISVQSQLAACRDVLDRNGLKPKDEVVVKAEFDATRFSDWTDDDLKTFIALARRASTLSEASATDGDAEAE